MSPLRRRAAQLAAAAAIVLAATAAAVPAAAVPANAQCNSGDIVNDYGSCSGGFAIAYNGANQAAAVDYSGYPLVLTFHDSAAGVDWYTVSYRSSCANSTGAGNVVVFSSCPGGLGTANTDSAEWWGLYYNSAHGCDVVKNRHDGDNWTAELYGGAILGDDGGGLSGQNCWVQH